MCQFLCQWWQKSHKIKWNHANKASSPHPLMSSVCLLFSITSSFFYLPTIMLNMYFELLTLWYNVCFMPQLSYFIYHFLFILCYCNNICKICIYCLIICEQLKRVVVGRVMALLRFVKCLDSPNHVDKVNKPVLNLYLNTSPSVVCNPTRVYWALTDTTCNDYTESTACTLTCVCVQWKTK